MKSHFYEKQVIERWLLSGAEVSRNALFFKTLSLLLAQWSSFFYFSEWILS